MKCTILTFLTFDCPYKSIKLLNLLFLDMAQEHFQERALNYVYNFSLI